ncbi:MAG TPA: hypothetical protein VNI02_22920 [Blastocatellia bacterium]|nr:hypothetical protein [Blastocatellia bacterium]
MSIANRALPSAHLISDGPTVKGSPRRGSVAGPSLTHSRIAALTRGRVPVERRNALLAFASASGQKMSFLNSKLGTSG